MPPMWIQQRAAVVGGYDDPSGIVVVGFRPTEYFSDFQFTQDPLSDSGMWQSPPQPSGIKWTKMVTNAAISDGIAYGTNGVNDTFDDSYAKLTGVSFPSATSIEIVTVLYRDAALAGGSVYPEKEIWFCIDDGDDGTNAFLRGYEVMLNPAGFSNMGKWLGGQTAPDIPVFANSVNLGDVADGAEFKARITRSGSTNTIEMYFNGTLQYSNTDTNFGSVASYTIGAPGFGAFARPASVGDHNKFGFKSISIKPI